MSVKHKIKDSKGNLVEVELTPRRAIRKFCVKCMCFVTAEVPQCTVTYCPLFPFRTGDAHLMGPEQREKIREASINRLKTESTVP